ncbi:TPA: hypothetical protein ACPKAL_000995 [Vibrio alginolyticus]|uniref:hypothetical protein n=1 Tax=Vibrio alginolyticus TaxID=663 RepID=UPI00069BF23A|nr:hypothetical protein [Vibrio alginolyticus]MDM4737518.1 hypothetical protein [Vibrio alginolyticus]MDM4757865.1 hypothetical protein [Vibrio alginolyticus]
MLSKIKLVSTVILVLVCVSSEMALAKEKPTTFSLCTNAKKVQITDFFVGWGRDNPPHCEDGGNCISFRYKTQSGTSEMGFVHTNMNLNVGDKGKAMFNILKTAHEHQLPVNLYGSPTDCNSKVFYGVEIIKY